MFIMVYPIIALFYVTFFISFQNCFFFIFVHFSHLVFSFKNGGPCGRNTFSHTLVWGKRDMAKENGRMNEYLIPALESAAKGHVLSLLPHQCLRHYVAIPSIPLYTNTCVICVHTLRHVTANHFFYRFSHTA